MLASLPLSPIAVNLLTRGAARLAARRGIPAGRAYREACRTYREICGMWLTFADAYTDEVRALVD